MSSLALLKIHRSTAHSAKNKITIPVPLSGANSDFASSLAAICSTVSPPPTSIAVRWRHLTLVCGDFSC